jgi:hypothetical protein
MEIKSPPATDPDAALPKWRPARHIIAALTATFLLTVGALHMPVDSLLPDSFELFFYPSFTFFMPLTVFYSKLLPPGWDTNTVAGGLTMCGMDLLLAAFFCLPFLFYPGRRQNIFAALSLGLLLGYTAVAGYWYFHLHGI